MRRNSVFASTLLQHVHGVKWFAPECAQISNWFASTRKYVAFCDANHLIFITDWLMQFWL